MRLLAALLALAFVGASCPAQSKGSASDDAVCAKLAAVGCQLGLNPGCVDAYANLREIGPTPDACIIGSATCADALACFSARH